MAIVPDKHLDLVVQGSMILFMEIYLFFQGLYSLMCVTFVFLYMASGYRKARMGSTACIIVLGDIGRSPRMQYHAESFAKFGFDVDIVGYGGSTPLESLTSNENVRLHYMGGPPQLKFLPSILRYPGKVILQALQLTWYMLTQIKWPSHVIVQNPPTIPTLAVAWIIGRKIYGSKYIIDWHNYGYTILGLSLGKDHALVRLAERFERLFCKCADDHLCVTEAMKEDLRTNWGLENNVVTLYDRAAEAFQQTPLEEKHELFKRLSEQYPAFKGESPDETAFTRMVDGAVQLKADRPSLVISSTSWTEDEDFSILLAALEKYEETADQSKSLPNLVCAITGKGPQKQHYEEIISRKSFQHVTVCTPWLTAEDYPRLVGSADLGVCLHTSSSGLDLPMKVVDMFGCGLPVCAVQFKCLDELVVHEKNGLVFHDQEELSAQVQELLTDFPNVPKLGKFRENLKEFQELRWEESWMKTVKPMLYT